MTATTPRYDLTYPTGTDQVNDTPTIYKNMADSIENALATVDDRQTGEAVKPVVRTTLDQLVEASAVDGQSGLVTGAGTAQGLYYRLGDQWIPLAPRAKRRWYGNFTRSDGQLQINPSGDTGLTITKKSGSDDITVSNNAKGSYLRLPAGLWLVKAQLQFTGIHDQTWVRMVMTTINGASGLMPSFSEKSTSGNAYDGISVFNVVASDGEGGAVQPILGSNAAGTMRLPGEIGVIEL